MSADFLARRQRELAAERAARKAALDRGELVIDPPGRNDGPQVVAVIETRLAGMPGLDRWAQQKRLEAFSILLDGALAMSGSDLRIEGYPAGRIGPLELPEARPSRDATPRKASAKTKSKPRVRPKKATQKAPRSHKEPKVRPVPKPRPERPAPPDEVRCAAMNVRGVRCKLESVTGAGGACLLHAPAG
jgi:hypothetical protein